MDSIPVIEEYRKLPNKKNPKRTNKLFCFFSVGNSFSTVFRSILEIKFLNKNTILTHIAC